MSRLRNAFHQANIEAGLAMVGFGASSAFWLLLAFLMTAQGYGELMTVQASVLLVVSALTFRTHDLFFNLVAQQGHGAGHAYRIARASELAATALATAIVAIGAAVILLRQAETASFAIALGYALLAALGANQGASIGRLRHLQRGDVIARTDAVASLAWGLACLAAFAVRGLHPFAPLLVGAVPPFVRSMLLARAARRLAPEAAPPAAMTRDELARTARYLAGTQLTNFLKNGAVSIETVILAAFAAAPMVAMYRVARAVLGIGVAALNVAYQRTYPALAKAASAAEFRAAITALERRSLAISLATYPLSAVTALAYAWLKHDVGIAALQLLTLGTFAASLPSALQQGSFAVLSLKGDHRSANAAYILWFVALALGSAALLVVPRVEVFVAALIFAGVARFWYLRRRARLVGGYSAARTPAASDDEPENPSPTRPIASLPADD